MLFLKKLKDTSRIKNPAVDFNSRCKSEVESLAELQKTDVISFTSPKDEIALPTTF